ncbi:hypothetical protein [Streptomyces sp. XH2]|uniref:hypothetical protein n=1 Tax=Streptomyces sp. XH2 TaxID=3412483 RepID=UPI003C7E14BF
MSEDRKARSARADRLHRLVERLRASEAAQPPAEGEPPGDAGPGGPNLREAVHRRMRELDEADRKEKEPRKAQDERKRSEGGS